MAVASPASAALIRERNLLARQRGRRPRAVPRQQQPDLQRAEYLRELEKYVAAAERALLQRLGPLLAQLPEETREDARMDAAGGKDFSAAVRRAAADLLAATPNAQLAEVARTVGKDTSNLQKQQLRRQFTAAFGVDVLKAEPALTPEVEAFVKENVALIRTVGSRYFAQVEAEVLKALASGKRAPALAKLIEERTGVAKSNAARIARDQVGKLYTALDRVRQQKLGVKRYRWRTVRDNRVRDEHEDREGKVFSWDNPPEGGHPGKAILCRCSAEPVLDDILEGVDRPEEAMVEEVRETVFPEPVIPEDVLPPPPDLPDPPEVPDDLPNGPVRGGGADEVMRDFPQIAKVLGDKLRVDYYQDAEVRQSVQELTLLPEKLLENLSESLTDIHLSYGNVTNLGRSGAARRLAAEQPTGYAKGSTFVDCYGVCIPGDNGKSEVLVGGGGNTASPERSVVIHELGHVRDNATNESRSWPFRKAYTEYQRGTGAPKHYRHPYFNQPGIVGPMEAYAEAFSIYLTAGGGERGREQVRVYFGQALADYFHARYNPTIWQKEPPQ